MEVVTKEAKEIEYLYSNKKPMIPLTKEQQDADASSTHCYICGGYFTKEDWKVRDHCHLTDVEKLNDTCLPPKEKFYSRLNDEDITDDDYQHANHVWNAFNIKNLGDYSDLYVKTDVLLLSDIFENFRSVCMKVYNLDPVWYRSAPGQ
ncbi:DNA_pol_B_2 domain-containing protein [Trichonephila clavipes]|nr:DNA_pol_B_2 domain-containing protein [Trichonephila clavipes]